MEIKEAVEIVRKCKLYIVSKNSIGGELIPPRITPDGMESIRTIENALKSGYTLCKVNEAVEKMEKLMQQENEGEMYYYPPYYSERCIKILKEACK